MQVTKPIQASPEFIRDNQYSPSYEVIVEEDNKGLWEHMVYYYGATLIMEFPSGKPCFFCEVL
jgi:hypothetical protein